MAGLWGTGDYTFVLARLGPLHLGCNREVAALLRWLLTQVSLYTTSYNDNNNNNSSCSSSNPFSTYSTF